ncbi:MAG: ATP-dependent RNA helicase HrpA [Deltaproteobacteria bacterium]|nr:ATP-dependent RNA helicase HrpA [Deltaproteobacteria bacterium]
MAKDREAVALSLDRLRRAGDPVRSDGAIDRIEARLSASIAAKARRRQNIPPLAFPEALPITVRKQEIVAAIQKHPVVIVSGETGSGKSTQIPKFCLAAGRGLDGMIGHTQPRRIAAVAVAQRIAEELGQPLGDAVGYKIRFSDRTARGAYIKIMTDGILLAETQADRRLSAYDTIIVDEAHERNLNIDFILGYLKRLVERRRDLKVVITSATIDTEQFSRAFGGAPVINVTGRTFPVEVRYADPGTVSGDNGEVSHVELAVQAVAAITRERREGDVLVFMPTERDIRDACEALEGRAGRHAVILPLFARLSAADQARVFKPAGRRKIIVATNVAETSITIPGIRYVVDTGLARISRYSPRTRTTALPVAPISRSSADQRQGRCGRVEHGVCIRLYSEEDYLARPQYTAPEILRANLAEVILRMIALGLGDVADFPFIDRPEPKSIRDGFSLLTELGAIEEGGREKAEERKGKGAGGRGKSEGGKDGNSVRLTETGRMMARMPLDPRLSRMLIAAHQEGCEADIAVIASALSIQDPRERPSEKSAEADRAHAAFNAPASDFLTLLTVWKRFRQARSEHPSPNALKRFCRDHFLSFRRMREWEDIHSQVTEIMAGFGWRRRRAGADEPDFGRIHRSILAGFLSHIAVKKEQNIFRAARGREVMIFPGSGLFGSAGNWIVAAEMVETSRLFARAVATIDAGWLEPAGGKLCRSVFTDPRWDMRRGEVVATEQVSLFGLIIVPGRTVAYSRINPDEAADIFIRHALVRGEIERPFAFMRHNQELIGRVQGYEDRLRRRDLLIDEQDQAAFYRRRLSGVCEPRSLAALIKTRSGDAFLCMAEADLLRYRPDPADLALYPERMAVGRRDLEVRYRFEPGAEADGATLRVPAALAPEVAPEALEWLVPGLLREKIEILVRGLPKSIRRRLVPLAGVIDTILREMPRSEGPLVSALEEFLHRRFGIDVPAAAWPANDVPDHLRMRVAITAADGRELAAGRDPALLRRSAAPGRIPAEARARWERAGLTRWDFGELPEVVDSPTGARSAWVAYPALEAGASGVNLKLYPRRDQALAAHRNGVAALCAIHCARDVKFLKRSLALPEEVHPSARYLGGARALEAAMVDRVLQDLCAADIRSPQGFEDLSAACAPRILPTGRELLYAVIPVLEAYAAARGQIAALGRGGGLLADFGRGLAEELAHLVPNHFIALYDRCRLSDLVRYIQALATRARRGAVDLEKDRVKAAGVAQITGRLNALLKALSPEASEQKRRALEALFWMIEEYKVSIYAQELGTAMRVSPKRLEEKIAEVGRMV